MNRFIPAIAAAAVVVAGGAYWLSNTQTSATETAFSLPEITNIQTVSSEGAANEHGIVEMVMGSEDAPITIIEYASFTCPHCASFHENVLAPLKADYVDTGKVKFVFRDVYFDRYGLWASMVARMKGTSPQRST